MYSIGIPADKTYQGIWGISGKIECNCVRQIEKEKKNSIGWSGIPSFWSERSACTALRIRCRQKRKKKKVLLIVATNYDCLAVSGQCKVNVNTFHLYVCIWASQISKALQFSICNDFCPWNSGSTTLSNTDNLKTYIHPYNLNPFL